MADRVMYWGAVVLGTLALALFLVYAGLTTSNQRLQAQVAQRQGLIDIFSVLGPVNQIMAQSLAEVAVKDNDMAIRDLLSSQGIKINESSSSSDAAKADGKK